MLTPRRTPPPAGVARQGAALRSLAGRRVPVLLAVGIALLGFVSQVDFRSRDATLSLSGAADAQVVFQLALWAAVSTLTFGTLLRAGRPSILNRPRRLPPVMRWLGGYALLLGVSSVYSPSQPVALVRGLQWVTLFALVALVYDRLRAEPDMAAFWIASRRTLWALTLLAMVATAIVPIWDPFVTGFAGDVRYRILETAPVGTGLVLGLAAVTAAGSLLGYPEFPPRSRLAGALRVLGFGLILAALVATKTRGALFATLAAILVLIWLHPNRRIRGVTATALLLIVAALLVGLLGPFVESFILREQTSEQLLTLTGRTELAREAWPLVREHWFLGNGYLAARSLFLDIGFGAGESHNLWLEVLFSTGVVGLLVFVGLVAKLGRDQVIAIRRTLEPRRAMVRESVAILTFLLVSGMVTDGFAGATGTDTVALMWAVLLVVFALRPEGRTASSTS